VTEAAPPSPLTGGGRSASAPERARATSFGDIVAQTLLVAYAGIAFADRLFPLSGSLSVGLAAASSILAVPWLLLLFRGSGGAAGGPRTRAFSGRLVIAGLMLAFLTAKWLVLLRADGRPEFAGAARSYSLLVLVAAAVGLFARSMPAARLMALVSDHPARLMALSFGGAGVLGAALLSLPIAVERMSHVSVVDNLFTAFSAVCVTGLAVNNLAETYTVFGQAVICALIQVGGLGIMVLSAAFVILAGQKLRVKSSAVIAQMVDASSLASMRRTVMMIILFTLLIEAAGAVLLYARFEHYPELATRFGGALAGPGNLWWAAIFHSVSGFCGAGMSNAQAGLVPLVGDAGVLFTVALLGLLGGLGFPVLDELSRAAFNKLRRRRLPALSLHTRISLRVTALLLALMALVYGVFEWGRSLAHLHPLARLGAAAFHSVTALTSGFNVVDIGAMQPAVLVLTCAAMFIGACPGSTAGGIKTTTLAVLFASMRAELRGQTTPELLDRALPELVVRKAIGVAFLSLALVLLGSILLMLLEPHDPLAMAFEATSALSTTGLSTGITPKLGTPAKVLVILMMFIGRIGPLTIVLAFSVNAKPRPVELPRERILIG
jgi:trk system potassium uptake protein